MLTRRAFLASTAAAASAAPPPQGVLVDTHIHLFDPQRFPYHAAASYKPPAEPLEPYAKFATEAGIAHAIVVHPEPYQDDHRYLEYCFAHEPSSGFFKGTCLFDPIVPETPARIAALVKTNPGRIVGLRIHVNRGPGVPPTTSGAIRDRDLKHPAMKQTWRAAHESGLAIQMHFTPLHAPEIAALAAEFKGMPVILDHLARAGQGTPAQYDDVLRMSRLPNVYMKFSGVQYSSKEKHPYRDVRPLVQKTFGAFGADRMIWGGLGMNQAEFAKAQELFDTMFDFAKESDRAKIRGLNAVKLFRFA